jgi:hypothetical protein
MFPLQFPHFSRWNTIELGGILVPSHSLYSPPTKHGLNHRNIHFNKSKTMSLSPLHHLTCTIFHHWSTISIFSSLHQAKSYYCHPFAPNIITIVFIFPVTSQTLDASKRNKMELSYLLLPGRISLSFWPWLVKF